MISEQPHSQSQTPHLYEEQKPIQNQKIESRQHKSKHFKNQKFKLSVVELNDVKELYILRDPNNFTSARLLQVKFLKNILALSKYESIMLVIRLLLHIYVYPFMKWYLIICLFVSRAYEFTYPALINTPFTDNNISSFIYSNYLINDLHPKNNIVTNNTITNNINTNNIITNKNILNQIQLSLNDIQIVFDQLNLTLTDVRQLHLQTIKKNTVSKPIETIES